MSGPQDTHIGRWGCSFLVIAPVVCVITIGWWFRAYIIAQNRENCANCMHEIMYAAILYANDHGGAFPNDLSTLELSTNLTPAVFICPASSDKPSSGATAGAIATDLKRAGHLSYVYVGGGLNQANGPDVVALYEPLGNHGRRGMNVAFADGHIEWLTAAEAQPILKQAASGVHRIRWSPTTAPATAPMTRVVDRVQP